jgi:hypothetical protein
VIPLKAILKWTTRGYMLGAIFWAFGYWIWKYTKIEVVEETKISIGLIPLAIIIVFSAIIVYGGLFILLVTWWQKIKDDVFSIYTFIPIYILLVGTLGIAWGIADKLKLLIMINADKFVTDIIGYQTSMVNTLLILASGIVVGTIGHIYSIKP